MAAAGWVLDTAIRRTAAGSRPAARAARSMRSCTAARPRAMSGGLPMLEALHRRTVGGVHGEVFDDLGHRQADHAGVGAAHRADEGAGEALDGVAAGLAAPLAHVDVARDVGGLQRAHVDL